MRTLIASLIGLTTIMSWASPATAAVEDLAGDLETARVSVVEGALYGRGPFDEDASELITNAILRSGDEVFTDEDTFAELELPGGTFVRLAPETSVVLQRVDDAGLELAIADGAVYVSHGFAAPPATVLTFGGTVEVDSDSVVRVGNDADLTHLWISAAQGEAELVRDERSILVKEGTTLGWTGGKGDEQDFDLDRGDAFDRWNDEREVVVRGVRPSGHLGSNVIGAHELDGNGTWIVVDHRWAWRPTAVAVDWRPYSSGHWSWQASYGWTWVSRHGWGYTTSHYGRWSWHHRHGWCWYPGRAWSPAWVVWAVFGGNVGWAPCDFRGRPVCASVSYRTYDRRAWSYCASDYFNRGGGHRRCATCRPLHRTPASCSPYQSSRHASYDRRRHSDGIGRDGRFRIRQFADDPTRTYRPVPIRDARRELRPIGVRDIPRGAAGGAPRDALRTSPRGGGRASRQATLLERSVRRPESVRPEPWNDGRERALRPRGTGRAARDGRLAANGRRAPAPAAGVRAADQRVGWSRPTTPGTRVATSPVPGRRPPEEGTLSRRPEQRPRPRVQERAAPRTEQRSRPHVEQRVQPRGHQRATPRVEQRVQPRGQQRATPRVRPQQRAQPRVEQRVQPRVQPQQRARPRVEQRERPKDTKKEAKPAEPRTERRAEPARRTAPTRKDSKGRGRGEGRSRKGR